MHKRALEILKQFKERLPIWIKTHIIEIRCFGSYARGEEKGDSDLDILVIVDRESSELEEKMIGSVTQAVIHQSRITVLVVRLPVDHLFAEQIKDQPFVLSKTALH